MAIGRIHGKNSGLGLLNDDDCRTAKAGVNVARIGNAGIDALGWSRQGLTIQSNRRPSGTRITSKIRRLKFESCSLLTGNAKANTH